MEKLRVPLELCVDLEDCSCLLREVRSALALRGAPRDSSHIAARMNRASSRVEAGKTGLFLTCGGKLSISLELGRVSLETSGVS